MKFSQSRDGIKYGEMEAQFEKIMLKTGRKKVAKRRNVLKINKKTN